MEDYKTVEQAAELLKVTIGTIQAWLKAGRFPNATKVGRSWRIPLSDIEVVLTGKPIPSEVKKETKGEEPMSEEDKEIAILEAEIKLADKKAELIERQSVLKVKQAGFKDIEDFTEKMPEYRYNLTELAKRELEFDASVKAKDIDLTERESNLDFRERELRDAKIQFKADVDRAKQDFTQYFDCLKKDCKAYFDAVDFENRKFPARTKTIRPERWLSEQFWENEGYVSFPEGNDVIMANFNGFDEEKESIKEEE